MSGGKGGHRHVRAPQTKDDRGNRQDNRHGGQHLHDDIQVVGNDRGERVHCAGENVAIDVAHLNGLLVLDEIGRASCRERV